ncbi:hypothetical protein [Crenothrix polyspora]|nr:hypothetical protein [Crenothrix polyspora]
MSGMMENSIAKPQAMGSILYSKTVAPPRYMTVEKAAWVAASINFCPRKARKTRKGLFFAHSLEKVKVSKWGANQQKALKFHGIYRAISHEDQYEFFYMAYMPNIQ